MTDRYGKCSLFVGFYHNVTIMLEMVTDVLDKCSQYVD